VQQFLSVMFDRYSPGYVPEEVVHPLFQLDAILKNYWDWFGPVFVTTALLMLVWVLVTRRSISANRMMHSAPFVVLLFFVVPVAMHHIVFFDWTAFEIHFFSVLKTVPFFCVALALLIHRLWLIGGQTRRRALVRTGICVAAVFLFLTSLAIYAQEIKPQVQRDALEYCNLGDHFRLLSGDDEVLFLRSYDEEFNNIISSIVILCAHRNVALYTTQEEAESLIRRNGTSKGVIFDITYEGGGIALVDFERIRLIPSTN
jgi:hypothetical protein